MPQQHGRKPIHFVITEKIKIQKWNGWIRDDLKPRLIMVDYSDKQNENCFPLKESRIVSDQIDLRIQEVIYRGKSPKKTGKIFPGRHTYAWLLARKCNFLFFLWVNNLLPVFFAFLIGRWSPCPSCQCCHFLLGIFPCLSCHDATPPLSR